MRPHSKIVQLTNISSEGFELLIALCADGSIWYLYPSTGKFELITEMDEGKYGHPGKTDE